MNKKTPFQIQPTRLRSAQSAAHSLVFQSLLPSHMNQGTSIPGQNVQQSNLQFQQFVNFIQNQNINGEIGRSQNFQAQEFQPQNDKLMNINAQNFGQNQILQTKKDQNNYITNNTQQSHNVAQPFVKQNLELGKGQNNQSIPNKINQVFIENNVKKQIDKNQKLTKVSFNVKCSQTKVGERVAIVGGIDELGNWDPEQATFLETSSEQFPNWHVTKILPRNKTIEYKYLIIQFESFPSKNQVQSIQSLSSNIFKTQILSITWEQLGSQVTNRRLNTIDKKEIILNEEINNKVVIEEYLEEKSQKFDWKNDQNKNDKVDDATPQQLFSFSDDQNNIKVQDNFGQQNVTLTQLLSNNNSNLKNVKVNQNLGVNLQPENKLTEQVNSQIQSSQELNIQKIKSQNFVNQQDQQTNLTINLKTQQSQHLSQSTDKKFESPAIKKPITNQFYATKEKQKEEGDTARQSRESEQRPKEVPKPNVLDYQNMEQQKLAAAKFIQETEESFRKKEISIDPDEPIIMASFLLPYTIQRDEKSGTLTIQNCFHNPTIMYGTLESMIQKKQINFKWVGLVTTLEDVTDAEKQILSAQFKEKGAYPIFMTAEETLPFLLFYENNIRPLFHNFKDLYNMQNESVKYWSSYVVVNQKFANKIIEVKNEEPAKQIFIHNNHLLMVPAFVKKQFEDANIGLYFHSPFPSSAHFRIAKFRFEILKSLLHCDLVGFHLFIYARNFIKTVQRLCGFELEFLPGGYFGIDFHGKKVLIRVAHVGIDQNFIEDLTKTKQFKSQQVSFNNAIQRHISAAQSLRPLNNSNGEPSLNDKPIIICSIDSYHPMAGLKHKLLSYKLFLQRYPNYRNRIVLIQFVGSIVQAFDFAQDHQKQLLLIKEMRNEVIKIRDEIHKQFGAGCLIFSESNPPLEKRLALWAKSNIILVSALKDGLCIQLLEYVVCRKLVGKFRESCMICSEFAGCSEALKGVYMFNPFSITDFPEQLDIAISQSPEINEENMNLAYQYVCRNSMTSWTFEFLKDLKYAYQPAKATFYLGLNLNSQANKGLNLGVTLKSDFKRLNIDACYNSLVKAKKSVIIIEIEAMPHHKFSKNSLPTVEVIEQLYSIMNDNRNIVLIISNHTQQTLEDLFLKGRSAGVNGNHFWLAAESGYLFKTGGNNLNRGSEWQKQTQLEDLSWMQKVKNIMSEFEKNIDGSFIEQRQSCILWNYKNADKEQSMLFIHDLYNQIQKALTDEPIEIIQGNGYLEVKPTAVNKQTLIKLLLKTVVKNSKVDFIFYLGNSSDDEIVFEYLKSESAKNQYFSTDCAKFLCVLEKKPSEADYYLEDLDAVRPLLSKLQTATQHRKKNRSYADLTQVSNNLGPIQTRKLGNLNQSIANLNQYMNSSIDSNVSLQGPQSSSFIPKLFGQKTVSEMPFIEEESDDSHECQQIYQINQTLNHKKYSSLDDTMKTNNDNILLKDNDNFKLENSLNSEQLVQNKVQIISLQESLSPPIENSNSLDNRQINENIQINVSFNSQSNFDNQISRDDDNQNSQTIFSTKIFQDQEIKKIESNQLEQKIFNQEQIEDMQLLIKLPQSSLGVDSSNFSSPNKSDFYKNITQPLSAGNQLTVAHTQSTNALYGGQQPGVPKLDFSKMGQQNQPSESFSDLHLLKGYHGSQGDMIEVKATTVSHKKKDKMLLAHISGAASMNSKNSKAKFQKQLKVDKFDLEDQEIDDIDGDEESIKDDSIEDLKAQSLSSNSAKKEKE